MTTVNGTTRPIGAGFEINTDSTELAKPAEVAKESADAGQIDTPPTPAAQASLFQAPKVFDRDISSDVIRARVKGGMTGNSPLLAFGPGGGAHAQGAVAAGGSKFVGMTLGNTADGHEVLVKREVGATQGYEQKLQAIAVARLGGAEPAAVVQGNDGKWHALETTANFYSGGFKAGDTPTQVVYALPSSTAIADVRQQYIGLKSKLQQLEAAKKQGGDPKAIGQEEDKVLEELGHVRLHLASLVYGVPETEIRINSSSYDREPGKINLNPNLGDRGRHGMQGKDATKDFEPGLATAFEINLNELEKPDGGEGVMFHEVSHLNDFELAQKWVKKFEQESKHTFVSGPAGQPTFEKWMKAQAPKRLSEADAELVTDVAANRNATTEARSYSHAFLAALQAGAPGAATDQLVTYAKELKKGGPANNSRVTAALTQELQTAYTKMPADMKKQFAAALEAAKQANAHSWLSDIKIAK